MTEPLTPPECDLRGMPFMPLDVVRLGDSDLFALSTGDEFKAAVALWCKSWLQLPAASLPDDDRILAHLSGAGSNWHAVRETALRGWVKCSDGRLYHPVVAEKAREAWKHREQQRARANRRWGNGGGNATPGAAVEPRDNPPQSRGNAAACPAAMQGTGTVIEPPSPPSVVRSPRGCRLPADWQPAGADAAFAASLDLDPVAVAQQFRDFWHAKAGKDAAKLDWSATWRNWCRREAERRPKPQKAAPAGKLDWLWAEMRAEAEEADPFPAARMIQ